MIVRIAAALERVREMSHGKVIAMSAMSSGVKILAPTTLDALKPILA
jgi:hypothetical protein